MWRGTRVRSCGLRKRRLVDYILSSGVLYLDGDLGLALDDLDLDFHVRHDSDFRLAFDDVPRDRRRLAHLSP